VHERAGGHGRDGGLMARDDERRGTLEGRRAAGRRLGARAGGDDERRGIPENRQDRGPGRRRFTRGIGR